jgi:hypothetical protein
MYNNGLPKHTIVPEMEMQIPTLGSAGDDF